MFNLVYYTELVKNATRLWKIKRYVQESLMNLKNNYY